MHLDPNIAFWLVAHIHQLDTHAKWSAEWKCRRDGEHTETAGCLFRNYFCDSAILHEFIQRGLVTHWEKSPPIERIVDGAWDELRECASSPAQTNVWFEFIVSSFTEQAVNFSLSAWAYKYSLENLTLPKQLYYQLTDRLKPRTRFVHEWFALETASNKLYAAISRGKILPKLDKELRHELTLLRSPNDMQLQASCRSLFPLLERGMRTYIEDKSTRHRAGTLDELIQRFASEKWLHQDAVELLKLAMKPNRDFILHGRALPVSVARLVLVMLLEVLTHLGQVDA